MMRRHLDAVWSAATLGYVVAVTAAVLIRDYRRERARVREVVAETRERLAGTLTRDRTDRMIAGELSAHYDAATWPETGAAASKGR